MIPKSLQDKDMSFNRKIMNILGLITIISFRDLRGYDGYVSPRIRVAPCFDSTTNFLPP